MLTGTQSRKYRSGKRHGVDGRRVGATSCFDIVVSGQYDIVYKFYPKHPFNPSSLTFGACILSECLLNDACTTQLAKRLSCATRLRELDLHHNYDWQFHGVGVTALASALRHLNHLESLNFEGMCDLHTAAAAAEACSHTQSR